jgi:hypothetical protein
VRRKYILHDKKYKLEMEGKINKTNEVRNITVETYVRFYEEKGGDKG